MNSNLANPPHRLPRLIFGVTSSGSVGFLFGQFGYLRSQGFDVSVVSSPGPELELAGQEGASVTGVRMEREISPIRDLASLWQLWRTMRKVRPDIANMGTPKAGLLGGLAALFAGVPHRIYTLHGLRLETTRGWKRRILTYTERIACRCAHRVYCVSPSLRRRAIQLGLVQADKAVVVGAGTCGGIDTERFHPMGEDWKGVSDLRCELGIPDASPVIGFVGRFTRDKGIPELYQAFISLRGRYPELRLLLVGDFETGDPIDASMRVRIEADRSIVRTGFIPDPAPYYQVMDVCVLPTYREGFPGVPLEAQASGIPVVTTSVTGAIDSVLDGKTGFVVPSGEVNALDRAIDRLLSDSKLRNRMGGAGRDWVESVFRRDIVWTAMKQSYYELLSSHDRERQYGWRKFVKSLFDRTVAFGGLVMLSPLFLAVSAMICFSVGCPILFRQTRPGRLGKPFAVYKFRSMRNARDRHGRLLPDGERLTRLGSFLRSCSLDELPQLWNVLRGDISLVGPRPLLMEYMPRYTPEQARRHDVMPGITGWAQINGRNALTWDEKFTLDTWYVDNWSLWLDVRILLLTFKRVLMREGISNSQHATMPEFMGNRESVGK